MKIYKQAQVERKKREKGSSSERRGYCVCYSLMKNKKKNTPHLQEEITCFFSSIGWPLPFLGRLSTNRVERIRKKKQVSNDEVQRE
jgi:hypothetical protein